MPWGALLIPVDELERLLAQRRQPGKPRPAPALRGRPRQLPEQVVERIQVAYATGQTLGEIAATSTPMTFRPPKAADSGGPQPSGPCSTAPGRD
jgi:hypothetical protein